MNRELLIKLDYEIDRFDFENILTEIYKVYKDVTLEGWLNPYKVVKIEGENYKIIARDNDIILRLTKDKSVDIPKRPAQIEAYKRHCKHLDLLKNQRRF